MSTITLDDIKATQQKLAEMIARFEKQPAFPITLDMPELNDGEIYVGAIVSADGTKRKHIILLPGESDANSWQAQMEWAASIGGELPDRVEGALLFATLRDEFKREAYWTREQHAASSYCAWFQGFYDGCQDNYNKGLKLRARAVRSVTIE